MEKNIRHGEDFVKLMMKMTPEQLCALSKILGVKLLTDQIDSDTKKAIPRDGADIIEDCIDEFARLGRKERRWLLKFLKKQTEKE